MSAPTPQPATPPQQTSTKAIYGAAVAAAGIITSDLARGLPWWQALMDGVANGGLVAAVVHLVPNRPKRNV